MPWILDVIYVAFLAVVSPVILFRAIVHGKYRDGWREKLLGRLPGPRSNGPRIWFHAVSVGEVLQLQSVLNALRKERRDVEFLVTTTTRTGLAVAREKFPDDVVSYFPLDFSWAVRTAIRRVRPAAIVLVELELWPNFIFAARRQNVPLALINGRISEKSFRGYRRIRPLMRRVLECFGLLAVQNEIYARRLRDLGAIPSLVAVSGSIKFDGVETSRANPKTVELRRSFGIRDNERVFIAGSTQAPEEDYALDSWLTLRNEFPDLRLILVPRHKERFEQVARLIECRGLPLVRRTSVRGTNPEARLFEKAGLLKPAGLLAHDKLPPVLLLDTLGELAACWGLADVAFVGGSLTRRGGQNMIEPAGYGAAVLFGPNTHNFRDVVEMLLAYGAASVVTDPADLTATLRQLLSQPGAAEARGKTAQQLVLSQQGATAKTIQFLGELLPRAA